MQIELKEITKSYSRKCVLQGVSLTAEGGMCIGILGSNGSGKSTLLSILAGIQKADSGSFLYEGRDLFTDAALRSSLVGYVPQGTPLFEELTVRDNLLLWYNRKDLLRELESGILSLLGIKEFLKTPVWKLSGGMKKRLSIGCAMAKHPPILLLDEPGAALDLACKQQILHYLHQYKHSGGLILLTTHDAFELELCDRLYILKNGVAEPCIFNGDLQALTQQL